MKKLLSFLAFILLISFGVSASNPSSIPPGIFNDDLSKLDCDMADLSQLEALIGQTNATQSQLLKAENPLMQHVLQDGEIAGSLFGSSAPEHERLMGIPGFLWGFCCSIFGTLLVYLAIDDPVAKKKEGTQAIIGCAVGAGLWAGLYLLLVLSMGYY